MTLATEPLTSSAGRMQRLAAPVGLAVVTAAATTALHFRDPHESGSWGYCPFLLITGHPCPGCGGLRAVNDLTHLDLVGAASSNLLFVASIPFLVWAWLRWMQRAWAGPGTATRSAGISTPAVWVILALVIGFWVLRSLPFAAWLVP